MLPTGEVTLLFSDIEGSTRMLEALGDSYGAVLTEHRALLREAWAGHRGVEVSTDGDSFFVAFAAPQDAVDAAVQAQRDLRSHGWPEGRDVRVRMGIHTGRPRLDGDGDGDGDYWGADVHLAARVAAAAHGGQVLLTAPTAARLSTLLDDLGEWRLRDFDDPVRLLQPVIDGEGANAFPPPRALDVRRSNLPQPTTPLLGREAEAEELERLLTSGSSRLVTIVGVGGEGKTRLALEVGQALLEDFSGGVFFADLTGIADAAAIPQLIGSVLGTAPTAEAVRDHVRDRRLLLIIDNCEHLLDGVDVIAGWLAGAPELRVLATSQALLRLRGEHSLALDSLALPTDDDGALDQIPSVRLFVDRARAADPGFALSDGNAAAVADICRRLEGMPMAIELAAARCRLLSAEQLARRLADDLLSLVAGTRDMPARQRSLRGAMEWTTGLLGDDERTLFARWGVFHGRPTLARAQAVCGSGVEEVEALLEYSLVRRDADDRLRMPRSVHAYARLLLDRSGDAEALARRHATVMADVADGQYAAFMFDTAAVRAEVIADRDDLFGALRWADANDPALHARLAGSMALPLVTTGGLLALAPDVERGLARVTDPLQRIRLLVAQGIVAYQRGERERERKAFEEALDETARLGLAAERALILAIFAKAVSTSDQPEIDAHALLSEARSLAPVVTTPGFVDLLDGLTGEAYLTVGRVDEAAELLLRSSRGGTARHFAAFGMAYYMPDIECLRGNYAAALPGYVRVARQAIADGAEHDVLWQVQHIAVCLIALGHAADGLALIGAAGGPVGGRRRDGTPAVSAEPRRHADGCRPRCARRCGCRRQVRAREGDALGERGRPRSARGRRRSRRGLGANLGIERVPRVLLELDRSP